MKRLIAVVIDLLVIINFLAVSLFVIFVFLIKMGLIDLANSQRSLVALGIGGACVFLILSLWLVFTVYKTHTTLGGYILGLEYDNVDMWAVIIRFGVGLLLDIVLLPVSLILLILNKPLIGEKLAGLKIKSDKKVRWLWMIFFLLSIIGVSFLYLNIYSNPKAFGSVIEGSNLQKELELKVLKDKNVKVLGVLQRLGLNSNILDCYDKWLKESTILSNCTDFKQEDIMLQKYYYENVLSTVNYNMEILDVYWPLYSDLLKSKNVTVDQNTVALYIHLLEVKQNTPNDLDIKGLESKIVTLRKYIVDAIVKSEQTKDWYKPFLEVLLETDPTEAVRLLKLLEKYNQAWVYFLLGEYYYKLEQKKLAKEYFSKAVKLDPSFQDKVSLLKL